MLPPAEEDGRGNASRGMHKKSTSCPCPEQDYLDQVQNRTKEKRYTFDVAFAPTCRWGREARWMNMRVPRGVNAAKKFND